MKPEQIQEFRSSCNTDARDFYKEINERIVLVIIASLGFFISKTDSWSNHSVLLITLFVLTFILLGASFLAYLNNKYYSFREANDLIEFIDTKMKPDDSLSDKELLSKWETFRRKREKREMWIYLLLGSGLVMEVLFFMIITLSPKESNNTYPQPFKIQIMDSTKNSIISSTNNLIMPEDKNKIGGPNRPEKLNEGVQPDINKGSRGDHDDLFEKHHEIDRNTYITRPQVTPETNPPSPKKDE
jgi:hypothetical protein